MGFVNIYTTHYRELLGVITLYVSPKAIYSNACGSFSSENPPASYPLPA